MPFRFAPKGEIWWPVKVPTIDEDGNVGEGSFLVLYKIFTRAERKARKKKLAIALAAQSKKIESVQDFESLVNQAEADEKLAEAELIDRVRGWKGAIDDATGEDIQFSKTNLKRFLEVEVLHDRLAKGLDEASRLGGAKNSSPGPAG
ncbi:MAG TPA: hypothetical protein VFB54_03535 [Burkholderiales bacterium]|nr:hypothetical protein [Burkholderiales bacterium]